MNKYADAAAIALRAIWASKLRSLMTVLGNIVAVTSIVAVVSLIQGLNASVRDAILNQAGADSFIVQQFGIVRSDDEWLRVQSNPIITKADAEAVRRHSPLVAAVMLGSQARARVSYHSASINEIQIRGVTQEYVSFSNFDAERGRLMTSTEVNLERPVVVLGAQLADRLFGPDVDPLDKIIQIQGVHYRVVGVSALRGTLLGQSQDEFAVIPLGQFQQLFGSRRQLTMSVKPRDLSQIGAAIDDTTIALRIGRRLRPGDPDNFAIFNSETVLGIYRAATTGIFAVLIGVVALSLVVGGIVIMNIMLMVVSERTREIGLRKALGARRADIMTQMLSESIVLSVFGGVIGTIMGGLIATVIAGLTPIPASIQPWSVALGITMTALVGLFFGLYPASRAARLDPIEALRRE